MRRTVKNTDKNQYRTSLLGTVRKELDLKKRDYLENENVLSLSFFCKNNLVTPKDTENAKNIDLRKQFF